MIRKNDKEFLKEVFFPVYKYIYKPIQRFSLWKLEKKLIKGSAIKTSNLNSILFFSTYKCASTFVGEIIEELSFKTEYKRIDFESLFAHMEVCAISKYNDTSFLSNAFREYGFVYGPMRLYQPIPNMQKYRILLILRDPRDVLISHYYSLLYSHTLISKKLLDKRNKNKHKTIDNFVLEHVDEYAKIYEDYQKNLLGLRNVTFIRYEEMIEKPQLFLLKLRDILGVDIDDEDISYMVKNRMTPPEKENKYSHRRSGKSGQYIEKLKKDTVDVINERLSNVISALGFDQNL
jgi:hypothetical protein